MKASELRINNLVYSDGLNSHKKVHAAMLMDSDEMLNIRYKPIPLTEEWLVKLGFEKGTLIYKNDSFNFNGEIFFKGEDSFRYFGTSAKLKYVHTLQNLYFALTGQELTIKYN